MSTKQKKNEKEKSKVRAFAYDNMENRDVKWSDKVRSKLPFRVHIVYPFPSVIIYLLLLNFHFHSLCTPLDVHTHDTNIHALVFLDSPRIFIELSENLDVKVILLCFLNK